MFRNGNPLLLAIVLLTTLSACAQDSPPTDLGRKKVSDTILRHRSLMVPNPFDAKRTLLRLFPGKWYDRSQPKYKNQLISWICSTCTPKIYPDANQMDTLRFPYPDGVATRLLDVFSYSDSSGKQYKVMSFNHSEYDADGIQAGRFSGGLVGMATFMRVDSGWQMQAFQPAIGAYGSFSQAPKPQPLLIGNDQYAFLIGHVNGGAGGPFWQDTYLLALVDGSFRQLLAAYGTGRTAGFEGKSSWTYTCSVIPGQKQAFRDIAIVCKGHFAAPDPEALPQELKGKIKAGQQGNFTIRHVYVYTRIKGYQEELPAKVTIR
jgi:hypothetical protein